MANTQQSDILSQAVSDPAKLYGTPTQVLNDERLTREEKQTILSSWALDQRRLMESEDENMPQIHGGRPSAAALYQDILKASRKLED